MVVSDPRATAAGFLGGLVVLGLLVVVVGVDRVAGAVAGASPVVALAVVAVAVGWLLAWGLALRSVLGALGIDISAVSAFLVFSAATFANNVTPFGQAGGEPLSALLIAKVADSEYETGLAAIASVDAINLVPSIGLATLGLGFYAVTTTLGSRLEVVGASVGLLAAALVVGAVLGWRYRDGVEATVARLVTPLVRTAGRVWPGRRPPAPDAVVGRVAGFFATIERIAGDRRRLAAALAFSTLGWLGLTAALWLSLLSLGHATPFAAAMLAVPAGTIASVTPLPGGLGGVEAVQIGLLAAVTGVGAEALTAAVLVHRGATYWLPILVGGAASSALGVSETVVEDA